MSETVKLIIEIDTKTYNDIKVGKIYSSLRDVPLESTNAIKNGIPLDDVLDKISADIRRMDYHTIDCDILVDQEEVLYIIEQYKEEAEGKEVDGR